MSDQQSASLYGAVLMVRCSAASAATLRDLTDVQEAAAWAGSPALDLLCACRTGREFLLLLAWQDRNTREAWLAAPRARGMSWHPRAEDDARWTYAGLLDPVDRRALDQSEIGVERFRLIDADPLQLTALADALQSVAPPGARLACMPGSEGDELLVVTYWDDEQAWLDHLAGASRARALAQFAAELAMVHANRLSVRPVTRPAPERARAETLAGPIDVLDDSPDRDLRPVLAALAERIPMLGLTATPDPVYFLAREADVRSVLAECAAGEPWEQAPGTCELSAAVRSMLAGPPPASIMRDAVSIVAVALDTIPRVPRIELVAALLRPTSRAIAARAAEHLRARISCCDATIERSLQYIVEIAARTLEAALGQALVLPRVASSQHIDATEISWIAASISPVRWTVRRLPDDRVIAGHRLPAGTRVLLNLAVDPTTSSATAMPLWIEDLPPAFRLFELVLPVIHRTLAARDIAPVLDAPRRFIRDSRYDAYATLAARIGPSRYLRGIRSEPRHIPTEMRP